MVGDKGKDEKENENATTPSTPHEKQHVFVSSTAKAICDVIGLTKDLITYDKHHFIFKNKKLENSRKICLKTLPILQNQVKKILKESEDQLANWEKDFFLKNSFVPSIDEIKKGTAIEYYNKVKYGKKLLKSWNLDF